MTEELKACPFCPEGEGETLPCLLGFVTVCNECEGIEVYGKTVKQSADNWNLRPREQELEGYLKSLYERLGVDCLVHAKTRISKLLLSDVENTALKSELATKTERLRAYTVNEDGEEINLPEDALYYSQKAHKETLTKLDEVCEQLADREWQDIETAPRDGTLIQALRPKASFWSNKIDYIKWDRTMCTGEDGWFTENGCWIPEYSYPKYWKPLQPLPASPEVG